MNAFVSIVCVFVAAVGVVFLVLWYGSAAVIDEHDGRIGALEQKWADNFGGPADDDEPAEDDADTEEFPVAPATVPDGMPLQVQSALIERPHKSDDAPMLERSVNIGGTVQTFRIRAPRKDG